jgi:hypothetical protein
VVVAYEAEHEQVVLGVVATAEDAKPMVNVELAFVGGHSTGLAAPTSGGDQLAAAGGRELGTSGSAIVGLAEALAERELTD